jgi:phytoene desaturase
VRAVVIGAGLGGLAAALRLQGMGWDVTVVEQRPGPGGRADRLRDAGFTWDTGPSLLTMPWVAEETFAAAGLDLHAEVALRRLDPMYRIRWAGEEAHFDFADDPARLREETAKFSAADAARVEPFLAALRPIYEDGILAAGRRPFTSAADFVRLVPRMARLGAVRSLHSFVARHFEHPRVREAFSFHSLFIGGDPYRVPAIYGALAYLQVLDGGWYVDGGIHSLVEAMARPLDLRCGEPVERIEHAGGRVTGVRLAGGGRIAADIVVSNADVLRTHELVGRRAPRRRLRETMSCFLLYLGTDRPFERLLHHTLLVGRGYREFIAAVTRGSQLPRTYSTYVHAPSRTEPGMAAAGGDSLTVLLPVPNLRAGIDWAAEGDGLRDALIEDLETTFGLSGLRASLVVEHRMTPVDFATRFGAVWGNAFAVEPTLHQSAYLRPPNRDRRLAGLYFVGGGTHPGAGIPGVLLGAEVTAGLIARDHGVAASRRALAGATG